VTIGNADGMAVRNYSRRHTGKHIKERCGIR
jgi:hypothetical protein